MDLSTELCNALTISETDKDMKCLFLAFFPSGVRKTANRFSFGISRSRPLDNKASHCLLVCQMFNDPVVSVPPLTLFSMKITNSEQDISMSGIVFPSCLSL